MKELIIEASSDNLDTVFDFVNAELESVGCPMKTVMNINLAIEEIFVNISHYAYTHSTGDVVVRLDVGSEIVIEFEDSGKPFNPLLKDDPDISINAAEREIGGLGIFMVKKIMDAVEYRNEDSKNILTIRKGL